MKFITRFSATFLSLLMTLVSQAQPGEVTYYADPAAVPADLPVTLLHLSAEISFNPAEGKAISTSSFTFTPNRYQTDSIAFYTPGFTISKVLLEGKPVEWKLRNPNLIIYTGKFSLEKDKKYKMTISCEAAPPAGHLYFIGWRPEEAGKRKQIWAHRPHGWLPYMDGRITVDLKVTFDRNYKVFSNGERISVKNNPDGTATWHYRMIKTHPYFSTSLVIGDYDYKSDRTKRGVPLEYWYYRGMEDRVEPTYRYTPEMFEFFEREMGVNYPYPLYREAPVIDYMYGAMETTTATVFGDFLQIDPGAWWQRNYVNVNAHELAHQWFGNYISHQVNKDVWLTESFGTYYAKMFEKYIYGEDYYQSIRNEELQLTLEAAKRNDYPVGGSQGGVERIYRKGSLVLDMLRDVMGEREFRDAVKRYLEKFGFQNARTSDFIQMVYEAGKKPYDWFFEEWILHGGEPEYTIKYVDKRDQGAVPSTVIWVWQVQKTSDQVGLFRMPVDFEVHYSDGTFDAKREWISGKFSEVIIPNPGGKQIAFVLFDPGRKILKRVNFEKSFEELSAQALGARNMIDRYDALLALRSSPPEKKSELLRRCYPKETFYLTKAEIISQLAADIKNPETVALFREALKDKEANVRKAVLLGVNPLPESLRTEAEACLADSSWLNIELALGNLCGSFPGNREIYLEKTKTLEGWRGKNIRMKWLEIAIASGQKEFLKELIPYAGPKYEFETRMNALGLLKRLNYKDEATMQFARQAAGHWNNKLSAVGREYVEYFERK
jgi:aminopeptidase N